MIPSATAVRLVAEFICTHKLPNVVVDPVMVATSGDALCQDETRTAFLFDLMPLARIITPNIPEAEALTGIKICRREAMIEAAAELLHNTGCGAVLLKGGHGIEQGRHADLLLQYTDTTHTATETLWLEHPHIETVNTHGTGCTLSSAIASFLARGLDTREAVSSAVNWLTDAIKAGADFALGHGHGPVNHLYEINQLWKLD